MKQVKITEKQTISQVTKNSFIYDFMSSLRQKSMILLVLEQKKERKLTAITASNNNAMFVILIIGFTAGPAVSL